MKIVLAARKDFWVVEPRMKKLVYLVAAFGLLYIGLLAGCQKQAETTPAPEMPSTNAPSTNAPAQ
jgi:hypothetical protein